MMENTDKPMMTTEGIMEKKKETKHTLAPSESVFFGDVGKNLKKYAADMRTPNPLETLYENLHRLHRLFIILKSPWITHHSMIQKACAWYLAYTKPTLEETRILSETLSSFTVSVYYLAEWKWLINRMQKFFITEAKELKEVFRYKKELEQRHRDNAERLNSEGTMYCLSFGGGEIYGMLYSQIEELYQTMERFIEREKAPFECKREDDKEYGIDMGKSVELYADEDKFRVAYDLTTYDGDLLYMSAAQLEAIADTIREFLEIYGENGKKELRWDMADYPQEESDIKFEIKEDNRIPNFRTETWINKNIRRREEEEAEIDYSININDTNLPELSFSEFVAVYRKLGDFLSSQPVILSAGGENCCPAGK